MIDPPLITRSSDQLIALIHIVTSWDAIQDVMGPGIAEVMGAVTAQGLTPAGSWFTHHHAMDPETADFDICVPVTTPIVPVGRVTPGVLLAAKVARTIYHGEYEGLPGAWEEFQEWIEAHGHEMRDDLWECYTHGPESSEDPADWCTELNKPLVG